MSHEIKLSQLHVLELEAHDCEIISNAINVFGSGDHPYGNQNSRTEKQ